MKQTFGEQTPIKLNTIIGVGAILGALGGIYFMTKRTNFFSQILQRKPKKIIRDICNVCFANLDIENFKICTSCCNCKKFICRGNNCSIWLPSQAEWECRLCYLSNESRSLTSEWLNRQLHQDSLSLVTNNNQHHHKFSHSMKNLRSGFSTPIRDYDADYHHLHLGFHRSLSNLSNLDEKDRVRRHVEETISKMLGGSLDDVSVSQLYNSKEYINLFHKYHSSLSKKLYSLENSIFRQINSLGDVPQSEYHMRDDYAGVSNIKLRKLVERIIEEKLSTPSLSATEQNNGTSSQEEGLPYFDPKKYQELLATAVLNKIVETYNNNERKFEDNSSQTKNTISNLDKNFNAITNKKTKSRSQSSSSIEPQSDSSFTEPTHDISERHNISPSDSYSNIYTNTISQRFTDPDDDDSTLNDYLKAHHIPFPTLSVSSESADDEFASVATSNGQEGTWEDNWLFKRKKLGPETSVGMLVPAPKEDIKALIGDKSADEMSDLSETGSDYEDMNNNMNSLEPTNVRIHNQSVISGKNNIGLIDELIEQTSLMSTSSLPDNEPIFMETKNEFVLGNDGLNDIENPKLNLNTGNLSSIEHEAVNMNITSKIAESKTKITDDQPSLENFEELIIEPPNAFTDTDNVAASIDENISIESETSNTAAVFSKSSENSTTLSINNKSEIKSSETEIQKNNEIEVNTENVNNEPRNITRKHSAIEFLAAVALGPVLAFSTSEIDETIITVTENNAIQIKSDQEEETVNKDIEEPQGIEHISNSNQLKDIHAENVNVSDVPNTISIVIEHKQLEFIQTVIEKAEVSECVHYAKPQLENNENKTQNKLDEIEVEEKTTSFESEKPNKELMYSSTEEVTNFNNTKDQMRIKGTIDLIADDQTKDISHGSENILENKRNHSKQYLDESVQKEKKEIEKPSTQSHSELMGIENDNANNVSVNTEQNIQIKNDTLKHCNSKAHEKMETIQAEDQESTEVKSVQNETTSEQNTTELSTDTAIPSMTSESENGVNDRNESISQDSEPPACEQNLESEIDSNKEAEKLSEHFEPNDDMSNESANVETKNPCTQDRSELMSIENDNTDNVGESEEKNIQSQKQTSEQCDFDNQDKLEVVQSEKLESIEISSIQNETTNEHNAKEQAVETAISSLISESEHNVNDNPECAFKAVKPPACEQNLESEIDSNKEAEKLSEHFAPNNDVSNESANVETKNPCTQDRSELMSIENDNTDNVGESEEKNVQSQKQTSEHCDFDNQDKLGVVQSEKLESIEISSIQNETTNEHNAKEQAVETAISPLISESEHNVNDNPECAFKAVKPPACEQNLESEIDSNKEAEKLSEHFEPNNDVSNESANVETKNPCTQDRSELMSIENDNTDNVGESEEKNVQSLKQTSEHCDFDNQDKLGVVQSEKLESIEISSIQNETTNEHNAKEQAVETAISSLTSESENSVNDNPECAFKAVKPPACEQNLESEIDSNKEAEKLSEHFAPNDDVSNESANVEIKNSCTQDCSELMSVENDNTDNVSVEAEQNIHIKDENSKECDLQSQEKLEATQAKEEQESTGVSSVQNKTTTEQNTTEQDIETAIPSVTTELEYSVNNCLKCTSQDIKLSACEPYNDVSNESGNIKITESFAQDHSELTCIRNDNTYKVSVNAEKTMQTKEVQEKLEVIQVEENISTDVNSVQNETTCEQITTEQATDSVIVSITPGSENDVNDYNEFISQDSKPVCEQNLESENNNADNVGESKEKNIQSLKQTSEQCDFDNQEKLETIQTKEQESTGVSSVQNKTTTEQNTTEQATETAIPSVTTGLEYSVNNCLKCTPQGIKLSDCEQGLENEIDSNKEAEKLSESANVELEEPYAQDHSELMSIENGNTDNVSAVEEKSIQSLKQTSEHCDFDNQDKLEVVQSEKLESIEISSIQNETTNEHNAKEQAVETAISSLISESEHNVNDNPECAFKAVKPPACEQNLESEIDSNKEAEKLSEHFEPNNDVSNESANVETKNPCTQDCSELMSIENDNTDNVGESEEKNVQSLKQTSEHCDFDNQDKLGVVQAEKQQPTEPYSVQNETANQRNATETASETAIPSLTSESENRVNDCHQCISQDSEPLNYEQSPKNTLDLNKEAERLFEHFEPNKDVSNESIKIELKSHSSQDHSELMCNRNDNANVVSVNAEQNMQSENTGSSINCICNSNCCETLLSSSEFTSAQNHCLPSLCSSNEMKNHTKLNNCSEASSTFYSKSQCDPSALLADHLTSFSSFNKENDENHGSCNSETDKTCTLNRSNFSVKCIVLPDRSSSDSNTSEDSIPTVIDTSEVSVDENPTNTISNSSTYTTNQTTNNDDFNVQHFTHESKSTDEDDQIHDSLRHLLPGSIAERERKKWLNAVEMPNNPYSPEALKRRLSDGPERHIDIPNINPILEKTTSEEKSSSSDCANENVGLVINNKTEYKRYSRDYYINNDEINSENINKRNTVMNSSTTSQQNQINENESSENKRITNSKLEETITTSQSNYTDNDKLSQQQNPDIYLAKVAHVEECNPNIDDVGGNHENNSNEINEIEIKSASDIGGVDNKHKLLKINNHQLNSGEEDLAENNESENLKSPIISTTIHTPTIATPSPSSSSLSFNFEQNSLSLYQDNNSLTPSEDSDIIRIYDLNKQETKIIKDEKSLSSSTTANIKSKSTRPTILSVTEKLSVSTPSLSSSTVPKKIVTPASLKFLQPKRKIFEPEQIMSDIEGTSSPVFEKRDITAAAPTAGKIPEKNVIEPEVAQALPSVKALARAFLLTSAKCSSKRPERPRSQIFTSENGGLNNNEKSKPSSDSYSPPYQQVTYSPIGPLFSQIQQEQQINHSNGTLATEENENIFIDNLNDNEENYNNNNSTDNGNKFNNNDDTITIASERPITPVLEPGKLKDNIAFFENLKKN